MKKFQLTHITTKRFKVLGGGLLYLFIITLFSIGFSSWLVGGGSQTLGISVETGDVIEFSFSNSAYYLTGSEEGFNFYNYDNKRFYTDTSFSLRCKCRPDLLKSLYSNEEVNLYVGLTYSYYTLENYDIFNSSNTILGVPSNFRIQLESSENRVLFSDDLSYYTSNSTNQTTYNLEGKVPVYSAGKPCLYSLTKDYQSGTNYVYFTVFFDFINLELNNDTVFPQLTFNFKTNLKGVTS